MVKEIKKKKKGKKVVLISRKLYLKRKLKRLKLKRLKLKLKRIRYLKLKLKRFKTFIPFAYQHHQQTLTILKKAKRNLLALHKKYYFYTFIKFTFKCICLIFLKAFKKIKHKSHIFKFLTSKSIIKHTHLIIYNFIKNKSQNNIKFKKLFNNIKSLSKKSLNSNNIYIKITKLIYKTFKEFFLMYDFALNRLESEMIKNEYYKKQKLFIIKNVKLFTKNKNNYRRAPLSKRYVLKDAYQYLRAVVRYKTKLFLNDLRQPGNKYGYTNLTNAQQLELKNEVKIFRKQIEIQIVKKINNRMKRALILGAKKRFKFINPLKKLIFSFRYKEIRKVLYTLLTFYSMFSKPLKENLIPHNLKNKIHRLQKFKHFPNHFINMYFYSIIYNQLNTLINKYQNLINLQNQNIQKQNKLSYYINRYISYIKLKIYNIKKRLILLNKKKKKSALYKWLKKFALNKRPKKFSLNKRFKKFLLNKRRKKFSLNKLRYLKYSLLLKKIQKPYYNLKKKPYYAKLDKKKKQFLNIKKYYKAKIKNYKKKKKSRYAKRHKIKKKNAKIWSRILKKRLIKHAILKKKLQILRERIKQAYKNKHKNKHKHKKNKKTEKTKEEKQFKKLKKKVYKYKFKLKPRKKRPKKKYQKPIKRF